MKKINTVQLNEQALEQKYIYIDKNLEIGDYITCGKMLDINPDNARMRFKRKKQDAILALEEIILSRKKMVKNYKQK